MDGNAVAVGNANFFQVGQLVDVHGAGPGLPFRGTVMVTEEDFPINKICVSGFWVRNVRVGDLLLIHNPSAANSAMSNFGYHNAGANDLARYLGIKWS